MKTTHVEAYPLAWPAGRDRASCPKRSLFGSNRGKGFAKARLKALREIRLLDGANSIISSNLELRPDGETYPSQGQPEDKGVAIYFTYRAKQHCFACDCWDKVQDNIFAIAKTIGALRGIERWGTGDMLERAFMGFEALPSPDDCWHILGFTSGDNLFACDIELQYKMLAKQNHPDHGGSNEAMAKLNWARKEAHKQL